MLNVKWQERNKTRPFKIQNLKFKIKARYQKLQPRALLIPLCLQIKQLSIKPLLCHELLMRSKVIHLTVLQH